MKFLLVLSLLIANQAFAQLFNFEHSSELSVIRSGSPLKTPFAGGFNYVQVSDIDLDFDGDLDLILFDRTNDNILGFRNELINGVRTYVPIRNIRYQFPSDLRYRVQLVDYDGDGRKDIFTYGIGGIKVYKNTGSASTGLQWELASNLLYTQFPNGPNNLYVSSSDLPAIVDIEGDGDLDILTFNIGGLHLEYHQNQSQELYGHSDSLVFELKNECWGKFGEDANNSSVILNDPNSPCTGGTVSDPELKGGINAKKHSGSTILALDLNSNGVMDLILGDVSSPTLTRLMNGGTAPNTNSAMVSVEYNYPSNSTSLNLEAFPGAFFLDVDFDGIKDLVVGANAKNVSENSSSLWMYKNTGTNTTPNFVFQTASFLQKEMMDHGTGSIPVFFDQNNDGKEDLLVANFFQYKAVQDKESKIAVYRNTNTHEITFLDDDFLNLSQNNLGLRSIPTFADLNGDGKKDMVLCTENGSVRYYQNTSGSSGNASFSSPTTIIETGGNAINEGTYPFPQLFDLDGDGLTDLIIGKKTGELIFFKNTGTVSSPAFTKTNEKLGNIDVGTTQPDGFPAPHFFRHNDTTYLFLGSVQGKLAFYKDIDGNIATNQSFVLHSDDFLQLDVKGYSSFFVNDIDNDGYLDLFVGTDLGGIFHLEVDPNSNSGLLELEQVEILLSPNPSNGEFQLSSTNGNILTKSLQLFDLLGKIHPLIVNPKGTAISVQLDSTAKGVFFLTGETVNGQTFSQKIIVQ